MRCRGNALLVALSWSLLTLPAWAEPPAGEPAEPDLPTIADTVTITATATETPLDATPASVTVLGREEVTASAAVTLDDALRQVPGFTLFRRSGSRTANPTAQGASLRGIGGSAASRALVLVDGVPVNDPFGGWVYWGRVPKAAIERVEVLRGGASDLYGSSALAGVVQLVRRSPGAGDLFVEVSGGEQGTAQGSLWAGTRRAAWELSAAAEVLDTEGYVPVAPGFRGSVDTAAGSRHRAVEAKGSHRPDGGGWGAPALSLAGSWFDENRDNGTVLQVNDTTSRRAWLGADWWLGAGSLEVKAWGGDQDFHQTFTAVADDRDSESLVREQQVPAEELGGSARFTSALAGGRHTLLAGVEVRRLEGVSEERIFLPGRVIPTDSGGRQRLEGVYVEDVARLHPKLSLAAGVRFDRWRNRDRFPEPGAPGERDEEALSPRLSLLWQARPTLGVTAAAYRSFRAPTLNELYRGFRVGDVVTGPNPALEAERLRGAEAGLLWQPAGSGAAWLRATLFRMELEEAIANVTLSVGPEVIQRQRRNLGETRSQGLEVEGGRRWGERWQTGVAYLWTDAEVTAFPAEPRLVGLRVPQVPEHQASLTVRWSGRRGTWASLLARWADSQLDDDLNLFPLGSLFTVDLQAAHPLTPHLEIFAAAENLLDDDYLVGRTPVPTIGAPRLVRLGVRWR